MSVRGLFRHFFDTPGRESWEDLFETFGGFWGPGVWRLLYMAVPIAKQERKRYREREREF